MRAEPTREWQWMVDHHRRELMRTIREIEGGEVNKEDLEKLNNFVQFALALMLMEGDKKWARAKVNAELMNYMKEGNNG
jgi:flagellar motor switch protein FliG